MLEEYAQIMRLLLDPEQRRATFEGKHFRVADAPNNPKPVQPRIPIWIGGRGEKRTPRTAAKYADGWSGAYVGPDDWKHLGQAIDQWCETEGRDPKTIMRTVNLGFYLGADAKGAARAEEVLRRLWGGSLERAARTGPCGGRWRRRGPWSTSFGRSAARGSASRSAKGPTTGRPWRRSPPRSFALLRACTRGRRSRPGWPGARSRASARAHPVADSIPDAAAASVDSARLAHRSHHPHEAP
jgi:alkanesulfonate monooxygenase SsuD/methylene tetrahydromethanopterin reductase-like flavin-dependent oxidoreductase (luciferase family)